MLFTRKLTFYLVAGVAIILALGLMAGCKKKVDVVEGISPVSTALSGVRVTIQQLAQLPPAERAARLRRDWPHLSEEVVYYARAHRLIPANAEIRRVEFLFGSLDRVSAMDSTRATREGFFKDQLVARLHADDGPSVDLIVLCLNGMVASPKDMGKLQNIGIQFPVQRFMIGPREGLVHHVDYPLAIDLAEKFNLPLYAGRQMIDKRRITPAEARRMEPDTARTQVTVCVFEGDRFDLVAGTYTPAPKKIAPAKKKHIRLTRHHRPKRR
jgi:hypothetical protein